jgi:hypothetical protein
MTEKCKSTSPGKIQMKNWQKTIGTEEKLHAIHQLEKGELPVDICHSVRLAHNSAHTVCANANRTK